VILTDAQGRPIPCPRRVDYPDDLTYIRAHHAYRDRIADCANEAFAKAIVALSRPFTRTKRAR